MNMSASMENLSFENTAIVACGTMSLELNYLKEQDFLIRITCFILPPGFTRILQSWRDSLLKSSARQKKKSGM
jgi:hypothetical protein